MLTQLRLQNFKNFADASLRLGPFSVLIGANASGKSNIGDALRVLQGAAHGYSLPEICGGKFGPGGYREWAPLRGGNDVFFDENISCDLDAYGLDGIFHVDLIKSPPGLIASVGGATLSDGGDYVGSSLLVKLIKMNSQKMNPINAFFRIFFMRFLDFSPHQLRQFTPKGQTDLGDQGENLAGALQAIWREKGETLTSWLRELTPCDVVDLEFVDDAFGNLGFFVIDSSGRKLPMTSASDGTLRFLAMLALFFAPKPPRLVFIDEIEMGLHPTRLALLVDLIEQQTAQGPMQVIATTHSPALLQCLSEQSFNHSSVIYRGPESDGAKIISLSDIPQARELREKRGLAHLHSSGWFENILDVSPELWS